MAVAVTKTGKALFASLGFESHKDQIFYVRCGRLPFAKVHARIRIDDALVNTVCWRRGLTSGSRDDVVARCSA